MESKQLRPVRSGVSLCSVLNKIAISMLAFFFPPSDVYFLAHGKLLKCCQFLFSPEPPPASSADSQSWHRFFVIWTQNGDLTLLRLVV